MDVAFLQSTDLRLATLPAIPLPVHPTALVLRNILIPKLLRQLRGRRAPHARFAVEHQLLVHRGLAEAEAVFELLLRQEHGIGLRLHGDVDRAGDEACFVLGGLADVCGWQLW